MDNTALTYEQVKWAHKKWCEGYTQAELADHFHVHVKTIRRSFKRYGLNKVKRPLSEVQYGMD